MKRMTTLKDHERRITALEGCCRDVKETLTHHGETLYQLTRFKVKTDLQMNRLFAHFNIQDVTENEVDEVLDAK